MGRFRLGVDQKDTLLRIYVAAGHTSSPVQYLAKQLAPNILPKNASRYFDQLENAGWLVRYVSEESDRVFGVALSAKGVAVAMARRSELIALVGIPHAEDSALQKRFLPDKLPR